MCLCRGRPPASGQSHGEGGPANQAAGGGYGRGGRWEWARRQGGAPAGGRVGRWARRQVAAAAGGRGGRWARRQVGAAAGGGDTSSVHLVYI